MHTFKGEYKGQGCNLYISEMKFHVHLPVREQACKERDLSLESEDKEAKTLMFTIYVTHYTRIYSK